MKTLIGSGTCIAAVVAFGMVAYAETTPQTPAQAPAPAAQPQKAPEQQVTVVGCVQRETDYRRAQAAGRGGVAGTGVGAGNEYVLVNASIKTEAPATEAPAGTTGTAPGTAYELTGKNEGRVGQHVGKRVEIVGTLKAAEVSPAGPTGGATAGTPPKGVEVTGKDLKLRELEVVSVREATGTCPAMQ